MCAVIRVMDDVGTIPVLIAASSSRKAVSGARQQSRLSAIVIRA
jgi:hypothetical protein